MQTGTPSLAVGVGEINPPGTTTEGKPVTAPRAPLRVALRLATTGDAAARNAATGDTNPGQQSPPSLGRLRRGGARAGLGNDGVESRIAVQRL
jgi:hypothetical protein